MKSAQTANDNQKDELIGRTRQVWQPRLARDLSHEDARQIAENATSFFAILAEWSWAERLAANDDNSHAPPNGGEVSDDR